VQSIFISKVIDGAGGAFRRTSSGSQLIGQDARLESVSSLVFKCRSSSGPMMRSRDERLIGY
jgi:hypothetical protein